MELQELYELIGLQPEIVRQLDSVSGKNFLTRAEAYLEPLMNRQTAAQAYRNLEVCLGEDRNHIRMLSCQLECARRIWSRYQEKQIPRTIYIDTMKCFTRFIEECSRKNGRMFFDRGWWTYRQISMSLFRIGELEYEFAASEGKNVIAIHIPSDAALSQEAVDDSLQQAETFFQTYYNDYEFHCYICDSWLLSPALKPLLSEQSNILAFQKRFASIREDKEDKEYLEWLFQVPADTAYEQLPAKTSLQRKVRELLLCGGTVGSACGVIARG